MTPRLSGATKHLMMWRFFQEDLNLIFKWETLNNMPFNSGKFMNLRMSVDPRRDLQDSTYLFTPGYSDPIEEFSVVKDL